MNYTFSSKRKNCSRCESSRGFAPFNEAEGGYCHSCGYTEYPEKTFINRPGSTKKTEAIYLHPRQTDDVTTKYVDKTIIDNLDKFEKSVFADYFGNLFGVGFIWHCENLFDVRADKYGGMIFIYRDFKGNLVNMKSIPYQRNGKRDKQGFKVLISNEDVFFPAVFGFRKDKSKGYDIIEFFSKKKGYQQCLFNEYFLNSSNIPFNYDLQIDFNQDTPVILLESEKSVLIASYFFPEFIFIASCGLNGLTQEKAEALKGRIVYLCYDADSDLTQRDKDKIEKLQLYGIKAKIINLFEGYNIPTGYDIADSIEYLWKKGKLRIC